MKVKQVDLEYPNTPNAEFDTIQIRQCQRQAERAARNADIDVSEWWRQAGQEKLK